MSSVYDKQRPETIQSMFNNIARGYDRTNAIMSFMLHRWWNRQLIRQVKEDFIWPVERPLEYLDLCAGTGDITQAFLRSEERQAKATLLDFSHDMLGCAENKLRHYDCSFVQGDAQDMPLPDEYADIITVAYGIRNVRRPEKCIAEAFRVLKPGGRFGILELTRPKMPVFRQLHGFYLKWILPQIGRLFAADQNAYEYLCSSINLFVPPEVLMEEMRRVGFHRTRFYGLTFGTATIVVGEKVKE